MTLKQFDFLYRFLIFCFIAVFIVSIIMIPIEANAATEKDTPFLDVLTYGGLVENEGQDFGTGTYFVPTPGSSSFLFKLPRLMSVKYIDMLIYTGGGWWPAGLTFKVWGNDLNVVRYGDRENYWRLYGTITTSAAQVSVIKLDVNNPTSGNLFMDVLDMRVSSLTPYSDVSGSWALNSSYASDSGNFPGTSATDWSTPVNGSGTAGDFTISIPASQWIRYSHIDLQLHVLGPSINNLSASIGTSAGYIPLEYSFIDDTDYEYFHLLNISLDLSQLQLSNTPLTIYLGFQEYIGLVNQIYILSIHGWSETPGISEVTYWGRMIAQILEEQLGALGTGNVTDEQQSTINGALTENEKLSDTIDSIGAIERPDLDQFGTPLDLIEDINFTSNISHLTVLTSAQPYRIMLFIAGLFTLIGVILHGRRQ